MRHDTRSSRTQIHFIQISRRSKSLTISQNFFRTSYSRFWRYSPRNKNALHRCRWNPTVNKCDGSSAAKIQAGKTRHTGRVYARCGAEISTTFRWVRNRNVGMVETPWQTANLDGVEGNLQGGICRKETLWISPKRRGKTFGGPAEKKTNGQVKRQGHTAPAGPAPLTNQMLDSQEGYLENIATSATQTVAKGGPLAELAASLAISVDTGAQQQQ